MTKAGDIARGNCVPTQVGRPTGRHLELRQLRYFMTLAEELHFGRAAAREHIVQSALSQQIQRLERALGVQLVRRTTHHVELTAAGSRFLAEVREILSHVDRAAAAAAGAGRPPRTLRVGVADKGYDAVRQVLHELLQRHPDLEISQVEAGAGDQMRMLAEGSLDVGVGRASAAPPDVSSMLFRLDPLGVLLPECHPLAAGPVPVAALAGQRLLLGPEDRAPEFDEFVNELCRSAGFSPTRYPGSVASARVAADLVLQRQCVLCLPASSATARPGLVWQPLVAPAARYPWSVLWRAGDRTQPVSAFVRAARRLSAERAWLEPAPELFGEAV
ncbi:MAG TPA: LysR substrate-binding domain-containing protein [Mycobacteriales bacterium]